MSFAACGSLVTSGTCLDELTHKNASVCLYTFNTVLKFSYKSLVKSGMWQEGVVWWVGDDDVSALAGHSFWKLEELLSKQQSTDDAVLLCV